MPPTPKLFVCPKCRESYLGHDPLPDCPRCGYDYREREGFRWDILVYLLAILGLISYMLVASSYRGLLGSDQPAPQRTTIVSGEQPEKLPGSQPGPKKLFRTPYHESER
jgi:hypothetical protein